MIARDMAFAGFGVVLPGVILTLVGIGVTIIGGTREPATYAIIYGVAQAAAGICILITGFVLGLLTKPKKQKELPP
jgi:hypothetical protein